MRIFTIGETTYDILFRNGQPESACSGGSAYNSAISLGRCGLPVSLISTFGNDPTGDLSLAFLKTNRVDCELIKRFEGQSRIALAFFDTNNNAGYSFYPASREIIPEYPVPQKNDILLLGSSFALRDNGRENLLNFLEKAKRTGCIILYDPNARQCLVNHSESISKILQNIALATIVKGSDQDFRNIFGLENGTSTWSRLGESGNQILVYTKGADGAELFTHELHLKMPAKKTKVVSTIGAGDNFSAGIIYGLFQKLADKRSWRDLTPTEWKEIMDLGAFFASEVCASNENYLPDEAGKRLFLKQTEGS